jgi:ABC-type branched-subunit amino acid transport system ATPase component
MRNGADKATLLRAIAGLTPLPGVIVCPGAVIGWHRPRRSIKCGPGWPGSSSAGIGQNA